MPNNIEAEYYEVPDFKGKNVCALKKYVQDLYKKSKELRLAINALVEDDGTPDIVDSIQEILSTTQSLLEWANKLKGITLTHINHEGTAKGDNNPTFTTDESKVQMNYDCFSLTSGNMTSHDGTELPQASTTQAGTIDAAAYNKLSNIGIYTHVHHTNDTTGNAKDTFTGDANHVQLNFLCTNALTGNSSERSGDIPLASATQAGIISAETYRKLMVLLQDVDDPAQS